VFDGAWRTDGDCTCRCWSEVAARGCYASRRFPNEAATIQYSAVPLHLAIYPSIPVLQYLCLYHATLLVYRALDVECGDDAFSKSRPMRENSIVALLRTDVRSTSELLYERPSADTAGETFL